MNVLYGVLNSIGDVLSSVPSKSFFPFFLLMGATNPLAESSGEEQNQQPDLSNIPSMTYRRNTGEEPAFLYCSEYTEDLFGYSPEELVSEPKMPFYRLIHPADRDRVRHELQQAIGSNKPYHLEYRMLTRNKQVTHVVDRGEIIDNGSIKNEVPSDDSPVIEGIITPVSSADNALVQPSEHNVGLKHTVSKYDVLTNLPNRQWFLENVDARIESNREDEGGTDRYALIVIDLDNFQELNDRYDREIGDYVIRQFGTYLEDSLGDRALLGRVSGDRFGLFVPLEDIGELEEFLTEHFHPGVREYSLDDVTIEQQFSLGVAVFPNHAENLEDLVTSANQALKRVKGSVNTIHAVFKESDRNSLEAKFDARDRIVKALDEGRVKIHYQPVKDARDETNILHEALLRFETRDGEQISTDMFKKIIDESSITRRLDRWVIERAIQDFHDLVGSPEFPLLAVNMFPSTIVDPGTFEELDEVLTEHNFPPERFIVEIPETLMLSHREKATENIRQASRQYKFKFALDDFGVGHGSFRSLNSLPLDYLKIDGSFIQGLPNSTVQQKFVEMTAGLSRQMDLDIIGEWIETRETANLLEKLGVPYHQGYYYANPIPVTKIEEKHTR